MVAQGHEGVLQRRPPARVRVDVAGGDGRHAQAAGQLGQRPVARAVVAQERPLELDPQAIGAECVEQPPQRRLVVDAALAQPLRQTSPAACSATAASEILGGTSTLRIRVPTSDWWRPFPERRTSRSSARSSTAPRVCAWARVSRWHRFRQPRSSSTSSVRWRPSSRSISAPWIALSPSGAAAWANSIEPETPLWSVSAIAS